MSFHENAAVADQEPAVQAAARAPHVNGQIDTAEQPDTSTEESPQRLAIQQTPWWITEKFYWRETAGGQFRLSPLPEFMRYVTEAAPKASVYGDSQISEGSTEAELATQLEQELTPVLETLKALHDREHDALQRYLTDRAARSAVYSSVTQYEIDNWVAKSAARGQDASEHQNFGQKLARRDEFAVMSAVYARVVRSLFPTATIAFEKAARNTLYQQADMNTRDILNPAEQAESQDQAAIQAVVATSKAF